MRGRCHDLASCEACSCADAQRQGVTQESLKAATRTGRMTVEEAEKILGVERNMNYDEVLRVSAGCDCPEKAFALSFDRSSTA